VSHEIALAPTSLPSTPPLEFIAAAAEAGYDSVGLRLHRSPVYPYWFPIVGNPPLMRDVKQALGASGLRLLDIFTFYLQPETDLNVMEQAMAFGAELGARYAQLIGDDPDWARMTDNYARFCDIAAQYNLIAAIEAPVNSRKVNSVPLARQLIFDAGRSNAGIVLDPLQFFRSGDAINVLEPDAKLFPYTQFNDGPASGARMEPGTGEVPLGRILDALPPGLPLSVEWSAAGESGLSAAEWATRALTSTRRFLGAQKHSFSQSPGTQHQSLAATGALPSGLSTVTASNTLAAGWRLSARNASKRCKLLNSSGDIAAVTGYEQHDR
jgi:sugar phosphate isomerase/epimerase